MKYKLLSTVVAVGLITSYAFFINSSKVEAVAAANVAPDFRYNFNSPGTLLEAGSIGNSSSPYFWINSGGKFVVQNGTGGTIFGDLPQNDLFRIMYSTMNPLDTNNGYNPQNTFRMLTRSSWQNSEQEVTFRIKEQNLLNSPNRDGHNGILLMNRYVDQYNLYYAGVRNDGQAVIKKKIGGTYYTLAYVQIFGLENQYDREDKPSLLPSWVWMRLKTQVTNQPNGSVNIRLLLDRENDGTFVSILSATDTGVGGAPLRNAGYGGIRTDFMDVQFDNYRHTNL